MTINDVMENDEGAYQCSIKNGRYFNAYSITVRLLAIPTLMEDISEFVVAAGQNVHITCSTVNDHSDLPNTVTWWRNTDRLLPDKPKQFIMDNSGYVITLLNASLDDSCSLTCNVSNRDGYVLGYRHVLVLRDIPIEG